MARAQDVGLPGDPARLPVLRRRDVRDRRAAEVGLYYRDPSRDPPAHPAGHHHVHDCGPAPVSLTADAAAGTDMLLTDGSRLGGGSEKVILE